MTAVERLTEDDWERLREIRLDALRQDPGTFASSSARENGFKESHWRMRLRGSPWFVATEDGHDVGLVCAISEPGAPEAERHIVSLWVRPENRGSGVGRALLRAVESWALDDGAAALSLWILDGNDLATALYRRCGFEPTGEQMPLGRDPARTEHRWLRMLSVPSR